MPTPEFVQSLFVDGRPPQENFIQPQGLELKTVCLPRGTGGNYCTASRDEYFVAGAPPHGIGRINYSLNAGRNLGAWTLITKSLPGEEAQRFADSQPELNDGTRFPHPTTCVVNRTVSDDDTDARLYLPAPPFYADEVRARIWVQGRGYQIAPPLVCPLSVLQAEN